MTYPQLHQQELIELAEIAGISAAPRVFRLDFSKIKEILYLGYNLHTYFAETRYFFFVLFRILLDLLALPASPEDIYTLLKTLSQSPSRLTTDEKAHIFASPIKK